MKLCAYALLALPLVALGCGNNPQTPVVTNDFSISISPGSQTLILGPDAGTGASTETYTVTAAVASGVAQAVSLTITGLPAGVTGSFNPPSITGAGTSTLTLDVPANQAAGSTTFTVTGTALSGTHAETATLDVCIPGPVTLAVTQTDLYTCTNQNYQATFTVTNDSCSPVSVSEFDLTGTIDVDAGSGANCSSSALSAYPQSNFTVGIGATRVWPLMGGPYCCSSTPCPDFTCVESYAYQAITSAGTITAPAQDATIHLAENAPDAGCTVAVCP